MKTESEQRQIVSRILAGNGPDPKTLDPGDFESYKRQAVMLYQEGNKPKTIQVVIPASELAAILSPDPELSPDDVIKAELAKRWQVIPASELLLPSKPPVYLLNKMIRMPSLICFYGPPGNLKTMLAYDLAISVAAGYPWLPHLASEPGTGGAYSVNGGAVLILDLDNGRNRLQERIGALTRGRGVTGTIPLHAISLPNPPLDMSKRQDTDTLIEQVLALNAGLLIIDNLGTASGGVDENSGEMIKVMANLRYVAETTGAALIIIHHTRKGLNTGGREGDRLRGHSSIEAALDLALLIEREDDDITVKSTKTRDNPVMPFVARWSFEGNAWGALEWARLWHIEDVQTKQAEYKRVALAVPEILQALNHEPKQAELAGLLQDKEGVSRPTALKAINEAVQIGSIAELKTGDWITAPKTYRMTK